MCIMCVALALSRSEKLCAEDSTHSCACSWLHTCEACRFLAALKTRLLHFLSQGKQAGPGITTFYAQLMLYCTCQGVWFELWLCSLLLSFLASAYSSYCAHARIVGW